MYNKTFIEVKNKTKQNTHDVRNDLDYRVAVYRIQKKSVKQPETMEFINYL